MLGEQQRVAVDIPPGIADGQRIRLDAPRPRRAARRAARRPLRGRAGARGRALPARRRGPRDGGRRAGAAGGARDHGRGADVRRRRLARDPGRHAAGRDDRACAGAGCRRCARAHRRPAGRRQRRDPAPPRRASSASCSRSFAATRRRTTTCAPTRACSPSSSGCSPGDPPRGARAARRAEIVLAELLELSPAGLEETDVGEGVRRVRALRRAGELPELPALQAAAGDALVEVVDERGRRRLGRPLEGVAPAGRRRRRFGGCACGRRGRSRWPART